MIVTEDKPYGNGHAPQKAPANPGRIAAGALLGELLARDLTVWLSGGGAVKIEPSKLLTAEDRQRLALVREDLAVLLTDQGRVHPCEQICDVLRSTERLQEAIGTVLHPTLQGLWSLSPREAARIKLLVENVVRRLFQLVDHLEQEDEQLTKKRRAGK
jgi:hypothetical protein